MLLKIKNKIFLRDYLFYFSVFIYLIIFVLNVIISENIKLNYFFFTLVSFPLIKIFFYSSLISDKILSIFFFLGFWFKFSIYYIFNMHWGELGESSKFFYEKEDLINYSMFVSTVFVSAFLISSYVVKKININFFFKKNLINIFKFIKNFNFFPIFLIILITLSVINISYSIYIRGIVTELDNYLIIGIFKYWFQIFTILFFGILIDREFILGFQKEKYRIKFLIFILLLIFIHYSSILSRYLPIVYVLIMYTIFQYHKVYKLGFNFNFYTLILVCIIFSMASIFFVSYLRMAVIYPTLSDKVVYHGTHHVVSNVISLLVHRWVGIDAVISVISKQDIINFKFFKDLSSQELYLFDFKKDLSSQLIHVSLPGPAALFMTSGSVLLMLILNFLFTFIILNIEKILINIFNSNFSFIGLSSFILCEKYVHLSFNLKNFLYFSLLLILTIIAFLFFDSLMNKKK